MSRLLLRGERAPAGFRFPALVWSLLHVPLFLGLYATGIAGAMADVPEGYRPLLWPTFLPQATLLAVVAFLVALPFSLRPSAYRFAAPAVTALASAVIALDSRVYEAVHFHLNGFFVRVLLQPNALRVTGVPVSHVVLFLSAAAAFVLLDVAAGAWFIRRFASPRRAWAIALVLLLVGVAERLYGSTLTYLGGPSIFAAQSVLPLQVPVRMTRFLSRFFGPRTADQFAGQESMRLPSGVAPSDVRFTRTPDVVLVLAESLPADHLDAKTMPNVWRRTEAEGARFTRHYASSVATNFTVFSTMYGLQPQKMERVVGTGRRPLLFPAFQANGYEVRVLTASCLDWMNLKDHGRGETNFASFAGVPESAAKVHCDAGTWSVRDERLLADARRFVTEADPAKPLFTFMFLFGTHFDYFYPPSSEVHLPAWDGGGGLKTTTAPPLLLKNRARNAAHAMDAKLEEFLAWYERTRGRRPLVVFTGDHGEEFREKGHIGHGSAVTREQIHVPFVVFGEGVPRGTRDVTTSHVDIVPTLFSLLGDRNAPSTHSDGVSVFDAPDDRFVFSTVGWEPRYAAIGRGLKVTVYAGMAGAAVTDEDDRPLPDGGARLAENAGRILRALRGEEGEPPRPGATPVPTSAQTP
jgi:membrane-anchored protein YejM (alkaline phosphatase superfamily)